MSLENVETTFEGADAATVINHVVAKKVGRGEKMSPHELARSLSEAAEEAPKDAQAEVQEHVAALQNLTQGAVIEVLPAGVGGQYDGSQIAIGAGTVLVGAGGVAETVARMEEVSEHEAYHAKHHHEVPLTPGASAEGETVVTIGGTTFTETALIEGLTVHDTKHEYVSSDYLEYEGTLVTSVSMACITINDVREAVNGEVKGLANIDDLSRQQGEAAQ